MRLRLPLGRDRRRWKRHWFNGTIQLSNGSHRIDGLGIQVSPGGMYLFAIADLQVGSDIKITFTAPGSQKRIELSATVRHRAVYLYGVEFLAEERNAIPIVRASATLKQSSAPTH